MPRPSKTFAPPRAIRLRVDAWTEAIRWSVGEALVINAVVIFGLISGCVYFTRGHRNLERVRKGKPTTPTQRNDAGRYLANRPYGTRLYEYGLARQGRPQEEIARIEELAREHGVGAQSSTTESEDQASVQQGNEGDGVSARDENESNAANSAHQRRSSSNSSGSTSSSRQSFYSAENGGHSRHEDSVGQREAN
ncbi:MAG: hypothetical protein Q9159_007346 [Coniocarpon cinnabarinum]